MDCCFYPPLTLTHGIVIILSNNLLEIIIVLFDRDVYIAKYRYIDTDIWIQKQIKIDERGKERETETIQRQLWSPTVINRSYRTTYPEY